MATDVYVKFGESQDPSNPLVPAIEGDSDDAEHYWWCEMRDCGFELENPAKVVGEEDAEGEPDKTNEAKSSKSWFKSVSLKKRADWGSAQLFMKCCEAAQSKAKMSDVDSGEDQVGLIDKVTVHVCRTGGGRKIPFVIVIYYGVRVIHFKTGIAGAESSEEITFEFDSVEYQYQRTDPYTGIEMGAPARTNKLENHGAETKTPGGGQSPSSSPPAASAGGSNPAPGVGQPAGAGSVGTSSGIVLTSPGGSGVQTIGVVPHGPNGSGILN
jgi:type VI protein secretion system component Hcp